MCRVFNISRSVYYYWKKKSERGSVANEKPVAKNIWWKLPVERVEAVKELANRFKEIASCYTIGVMAKVSVSSVWKILHRERKEETAGAEKEAKKKPDGKCEWLKLHACWAIDTMHVKWNGRKLYVKVLIDECSRMIIGLRVSLENTGAETVALLKEAREIAGMWALVIKMDNGPEFRNREVEELLKENRVVALYSPKYYAPFNGRIEREIRILRKYLKHFKGNRDEMFEEIISGLGRALGCINNVLPRKIFNGRTSMDIYRGGEVYREEDRAVLIKKIEEKLKELETNTSAYVHDKKFDPYRNSVVKSVMEVNLCAVQFGRANANQLSVC
jgi:hypothetical protein